MSRRRYISTDISVDKQVNKLAMRHGDFAAMLYTWMIPHAEDDGVITGDPEELILMVIPGRRDKTVEDVALALEGMAEMELIVWDQDEQRIYFPHLSFYKYQTYVKTDRRRSKTPDIKPQRKTPKNTEEQRTSPNNSEEHRPTPQNTVNITYHNITKHSGAEDSFVLLESTEKDNAAAFDSILQTFHQVTGKSTIHPNQEDIQAARTLATSGVPPNFILQTMKEIAADTEVSSMKYFLKAIPDRWQREQSETHIPEPIQKRLTAEQEHQQRTKLMALYFDQHGTMEGFEDAQPS